MLAINVLAFDAFRHDKQAAMRGDRRVPEANLLTLALLGGTPGAYFARGRYRHKTRKQPFCFYLHCIALMQLGAIGWLAWQRI